MLVSTSELAGQLRRGAVVVVHVAKGREGYDEGHIPGARYLGWEEITTNRGRVPGMLAPAESLLSALQRLGVGPRHDVVLYDEGQGLEAAHAFVAFDYLGLGHRTALLDGHLKRWKAEGRALSTKVPDVKPLHFAPRLRLDAILSHVATHDLVGLQDVPGAGVVLVDARPREEYTGDDPGKGVRRPGHIPGALSVPWAENLVSEDRPQLRSPRQLRDLYRAAGVEPGDLVVAYCRTGRQASLAYFTLKYLGYDVRLYDGSFFEWSTTTDAPVVTGPDPR
jgi:thiosulfate/3-mercaptopyruvate sulfurtransferase